MNGIPPTQCRRGLLERSLISLLALSALITILVLIRGPLSPAPAPITDPGQDQHSEVEARLGAVSSNAAPCSLIGTAVLTDGGNAIDAVSCGSILTIGDYR